MYSQYHYDPQKKSLFIFKRVLTEAIITIDALTDIILDNDRASRQHLT